jgi:hypothetical protein
MLGDLDAASPGRVTHGRRSNRPRQHLRVS